MEIVLNQWSTTGIHIALALILFLALNWIGRHSSASGYIALSLFLKRDTAPAFNFIFRTVGPTIFITIFAVIFYRLGLYQAVHEIWLVVAYYFIFRVTLIFLLSRALLVNWLRELITCTVAIFIARAGYTLIIQYPDRLTPDPSDLRNQLWILVIFFLYATANKIELNENGSVKRKRRYLIRIYKECQNRYGRIIENTARDQLSESIIYAILIFEQFNRPAFLRSIERLAFPWFSKTIGPMQITSTEKLSDFESVEAGSLRIINEYQSAFDLGIEKAGKKNIYFNPLLNNNHRKFLLYRVAADYNRDDNYVEGIIEVHDELIRYVFTELKIETNLPHWTEHLI